MKSDEKFKISHFYFSGKQFVRNSNRWLENWQSLPKNEDLQQTAGRWKHSPTRYTSRGFPGKTVSSKLERYNQPRVVNSPIEQSHERFDPRNATVLLSITCLLRREQIIRSIVIIGMWSLWSFWQSTFGK